MGSALRERIRERMNLPKYDRRKRPVPIVGAKSGDVVSQAIELCRASSHEEHTVYFVEMADYIKIGYTTGVVESRVTALETSTPFDLKILLRVPGGMKLERSLHKLFLKDKHKREWFRKDGDLGRFITAAQSMVFPRRKDGKNVLKQMVREAETFSVVKMLGKEKTA